METVHLLLLGEPLVLRHRLVLPLPSLLLQRQAPRQAGRRLLMLLLLQHPLRQLPAQGWSEEEVRDQGKRSRGLGKCAIIISPLLSVLWWEVGCVCSYRKLKSKKVFGCWNEVTMNEWMQFRFSQFAALSASLARLLPRSSTRQERASNAPWIAESTIHESWKKIELVLYFHYNIYVHLDNITLVSKLFSLLPC